MIKYEKLKHLFLSICFVLTLTINAQVPYAKINISSSSLNVFTKCTGLASADQIFTVSGSNLTSSITVNALNGFEYSLDGITYSASLELTQNLGSVVPTDVHVRMTELSISTPIGVISLSSKGAICQYIVVSGISNTAPLPLTIQNSLCNSQGLTWATWDSVTPSLVKGTLNGVGVTVTQSNPSFSTTSSMYSYPTFPTQYNVPNGSTLRNDLAGTFTFCFDSPVSNPQVAFSSIGNPNIPVNITSDTPYSVIWNGEGMTYNSSNSMTGAEGYTIVSFPGLQSCITLTYDKNESYVNIAFGAENYNCSKPIICSGDSIKLTASGGSTYKWFPSEGLNTTVGSQVIANPSVTTTYSVIDTANLCASASVITIKVNPTLPEPISGGNQKIYEVSPIQTLTATATGNIVNWYDAAIGGSLVTSPILNNVGTVIYYAANSNGICESLTRAPVILTIIPKLTAIVLQTNVLLNGQLTVSATVVPSGGEGPYTYIWLPTGETSATVDGLSAGNYTIKITDANGAQITETIIITEISVSEVITPNGDGINETWEINNIKNYPETIVRVYNRWGNEVFFSNNYLNDWDGHFKDSNDSLPSSSYFYQIDLFGDGKIDHQGWLYITK